MVLLDAFRRSGSSQPEKNVGNEKMARFEGKPRPATKFQFDFP